MCEFTDDGIDDRGGDNFWDCVDILNQFGLITDHDLYLQRLEECQGYLDPYDYGPSNPSGVHPDYEFCEQWQPYLEDCLDGGMVYHQEMGSWAELLWKNESAFNCLVKDDAGCSAGNELMPSHTAYINGVSGLPCLTEKEKCNFVTNPDPAGLMLMEAVQPKISFDDEALCFLLTNNELIHDINDFVTACECGVQDLDILFLKSLVEIQSESAGEFTNEEFSNLLDAFVDFTASNDPNVFAEEFLTNGINPLAINAEYAILNTPPNSPIPPINPSVDMDRDKFWEKVNDIKQNLLNTYPAKTATINGMFPCRAHGPAFEEAALASLGIPKNNEKFNGRIPDGKYDMIAYEVGGTSHLHPNFIEMKCHLANGPFDYSTNPGQFEDYLDYIQSTTYKASTTIGSHSLHLVLPAGVAVGQNIVNECNQKNIPLFISYVELGNDDINNFRVKPFEIVNISSLNRSDHIFDEFSDGFWEASIRAHRKAYYIDFNYTLIDFQKHADVFEASHLIGNSNEGCPPD